MILVSSCLAGINCRYDSSNCVNDYVVYLVTSGDAVMVCPEQLGGLSTPREPCEIYKNRIISKSGKDLTEFFEKGAQKTLEIALNYKCKTAILKSKSPSCGSGLIYNGTFSDKLIEGDGNLTKLLKENNIKVFNEKNCLRDY
jgi:uncharacterized protein YbbK (DUF523 family)